MGKHLFSLLFLISSLAFGQSIEKAGSSEANLLSNPGFENGRARYTFTGTTLTVSSTQPIAGTRSGIWSPTAASQVLRSELVTVPSGEGPRSCQASFRYNWTGTLGQILVSVVDELDADIVAPFNVPVSANSTNIQIPLFDCTGGDQFQIKLTSTASSSAMKVDSFFLGYGRNSLSISQADIFGQISILPATTPATLAPAVFTDVVALSPSYTAVGRASVPSGNLYGITFANMPPGKYEVAATVLFTVSGQTTDTQCIGRIFDGNTEGDLGQSARMLTIGGAAASGGTGDDENTSITVFSYSTPQINRTFRLQVLRAFGNGNCNIGNVHYVVKYFPLNANDAITMETSGGYVQGYIWNAGTIPLSTGNVAALSFATTSNLQLQNTGTIPALIGCSGGNAPTGTTCAAGNETSGFAFTPHVAGDWEICFNYNQNMVMGTTAGNRVDTVWQIAQFNPTATTEIARRGDAGINTVRYTGSPQSNEVSQPSKICGIFNLSDTSLKRFDLAYTQTVVGTPSTNALFATNFGLSSSQSAGALSFTARPYTQSMPTPIFTDLQNSLRRRVSGDADNQVAYSASFTCSSSSAIGSQTGSWLTSISNIDGNGACILNIAPGKFSQPPQCTVTWFSGVTSPVFSTLAASPYSATQITPLCRSVTNTACSNVTALVTCQGVK